MSELQATEAKSALERIAYLLERTGQPSYRVRAFRYAAQAVSDLAPGELERLVTEGKLTDIKGVGDTTARVITEAMTGDVPSYLTKLEAEATDLAPAVSGGDAMRALLKGDCHSHSDWSDGGSPIRDMAVAARDLGHEYLVLTDHSPRLTIAHGLDRERLLRQLDVVAEVDAELAPFRLLTGIEVDIFEDGTLDQDDDILDRLDVVVASLHSKLRMPAEAMTPRMVRAVANPHVDILGHCTGRLVSGKRPESEFDAELVFHACATYDTAVEINCRPERLDPPKRLLALAVELGCRFSIDTDAHAPGQLEWQPYGCARAVECGVPADRVVNTMDAAGLLAWTASHTAA